MTQEQPETAWLSTAAGTDYTLPEPDFTKPQTARMYDYYLGGKDHYAVDRKTADRVVAVWPSVGKFARANRHFMQLAVAGLAAGGVDQFLDIGTGIPTSPNVHEIAQAGQSAARILYTDHDLVVLAHARALMNSTPQGRIDYIQGDLRRPETILGHPCLTGADPALDLSRPVAVNLVAIMHFITEEDGPQRLVSALMDAVPSGSYLVLSHITDEFSPAEIEAAAQLYRNQGLPAVARNRGDLEELVHALGLELTPPGILPVNRWPAGPAASAAPAEDAPPLYSDAEASCVGFVARKP